MINLNYLTGISIVSLGLLVFLAGNILLDVRIRETNSLGYVTLLEESKFMLPFVLRNYYIHVIDWSKIKSISLFAVSFWYDMTEKKEEKEKKNNRQLGYLRLKLIGLSYALILYALFILIWHYFSRTKLGYQYKPEIITWLGTKINSSLLLAYGIDGLSLPFILLVVFIMPIVYFSNWTTVDKDDGYYTSIVGLLEWFLITVFVVIDLIMFYIFFESILPPLFVMIGLYGASQKFRAGYYLFLYTLLGSLFMLMVFVKMGGDTATTYFEGFGTVNIYTLLQEIIWVVLFVSFSVKTPLVPVHIWLPLAHSDANVSGSIVLASIVLKLALYGFIRILIGIFTFATSKLIPFFFGLCSLSVLYSSFTTIRQFDLKVLVAYSSIAHMASSLLGTFSDTLYGLVGSIIFGLAHGFVSPGLFILVGAVLYDRCGSRIINYYRGLSNLLPFFALLFLLFVFGNMGVPLTGNFIGEFLSLLGAYQQNIFIASIGATSVILSAVYSIFMYNRVTGGALSPFVHTIPDIFRKEFYIILPLLVLTLLLGIYPSFISYDVEFGLSNYLLFTIFPAVLMDKSGNSETSSKPSKVNSENSNLDSGSEGIVQSNTPTIPENTPEASSASGIHSNDTLESQESESTSSVHEESEKSESESVKSDSEDDHEYEEFGDDNDESNDSEDDKSNDKSEDSEDDENKQKEKNDNVNEDPPVENEGNLTDASIITNYSPSDSDRSEVEAPSSCSSYGSEGEGESDSPNPFNLNALGQFIANMFNRGNDDDNDDDKTDKDSNTDNNENNENNEEPNNPDQSEDSNENNTNNEDENNGSMNDDNEGENENEFPNGRTPQVPQNTPEAQYTVPNQTPNPLRGLRTLAEPLPQPPVEENRNGENRNGENRNEENNHSVEDRSTTSDNENEELESSLRESISTHTVKKENSTSDNKDNDKKDKDSNMNFNKMNQEGKEENQDLINMRDQEEPFGFAFRDNDFIYEWIKIIKIINSLSHSLKELLGFLIDTGLTHLSTGIFFIFLMNKIYKMYSSHVRPVVSCYTLRYRVWIMEIQYFIIKYMRKK